VRTLVNIVVFVFALAVITTVGGVLGGIGPLELLLAALIAVATTWWLDRRRQTADPA
jgi:uncharacterized OsmC-like protein